MQKPVTTDQTKVFEARHLNIELQTIAPSPQQTGILDGNSDKAITPPPQSQQMVSVPKAVANRKTKRLPHNKPWLKQTVSSSLTRAESLFLDALITLQKPPERVEWRLQPRGERYLESLTTLGVPIMP